MTQKQVDALNGIIANIPAAKQNTYREIGEFTASLGYMPTRKGSKGQYVIFNKRFSADANRTLLKICAYPDRPNFGIEMRYFANTPPYTPLFQKPIEERVLVYGWDDTCTNCGRCDGTQIYHFTHPNGEMKNQCGYTSLYCLGQVEYENVPEIKDALKRQDDFYIECYGIA